MNEKYPFPWIDVLFYGGISLMSVVCTITVLITTVLKIEALIALTLATGGMVAIAFFVIYGKLVDRKNLIRKEKADD